MKIGINGQIIMTDKFKHTGPQVYTENLISALAKIDSKNEYVIYLDGDLPRNKSASDLIGNNTNFSFKELKKFISWTHVSLAKQISKDNLDIYFSAVHTLPSAIPYLIRNKPKYVSMIHGLEYKWSKEYKNPTTRWNQWLPAYLTIKRSDMVIVPSLATKNAILDKRWVKTPDKIKVVLEGINKSFYKRNDDDINKIRQKYNIGNSKYLSFVSTIQPRKNIPNTIQAFAELIHEHKSETNFADLKLCISGKLGWLYEESLSAPIKYGVQDKVLFLGAVDTQDLPAFLSGSLGLLNFSFEEGFGLPVLEAMACGTLCAVSKIEAFKEIEKNNLIYADSTNVADIKIAINKLVSMPENSKSEVSLKLINRSKDFSWEKTAQNTLDIIKNL